MSETRTRIAIVVVSGLTAWGVVGALAPPAPDDEVRRPSSSTVERGVQDLGDADDASKGRMRDEGSDGVDANNDRRVRPGEYRTPERPRVRIRIR